MVETGNDRKTDRNISVARVVDVIKKVNRVIWLRNVERLF